MCNLGETVSDAKDMVRTTPRLCSAGPAYNMHVTAALTIRRHD